MSYSNDLTFDMPSDNRNELALTLAALLGSFGSAVGSGSAESLLPVFATAFPQLTAWLIGYLMYRSPRPFRSMPSLPPHSNAQ